MSGKYEYTLYQIPCMNYLSVTVIEYLDSMMVGNTRFILDCNYRTCIVHCVREGMVWGSPAVHEAESSNFISLQGAEMKNKKCGQTIKVQIPPLVMNFLPQDSSLPQVL